MNSLGLFYFGWYFDSYGCNPPKNFNFIKNNHGKCIYSEYQIKKKIVFVQVIVYIEFT